VLSFIVNMTNSINIGPSQTHVGAVSFGTVLSFFYTGPGTARHGTVPYDAVVPRRIDYVLSYGFWPGLRPPIGSSEVMVKGDDMEAAATRRNESEIYADSRLKHTKDSHIMISDSMKHILFRS